MLFKNDKSHMAQGLMMTAHSEGKLHVFIIKEFTALDRLGEKQYDESSTLLLIPEGEYSCPQCIKIGQTQLC